MTRPRTPPTDAGDPRELQAADWLLRLSQEQVSAEDIDAWRRWLAASALNQVAFERAQRVWDAAALISDPAWPTDREVAEDDDDASGPIPQRAAARHRNARRKLFAAAAAVTAMVAGGGIFWNLQHTEGLLVTDIGENRSFTLSDGSRVTLGGASRVRVAFTQERRTLDLEQGEAFFDVKKDAQRAFDVRAGNTNVVAIGTAFSVRRVADRIDVAVISGVVSVVPATVDKIDAAPALQLEAGMQTTMQAGHVPTPPRAAVDISIARREGRLQYSDEPLRYVVADLNRYSRVPIEIARADAGDLLVTGTVLEKDVSGWLQGLEQALPVEVSFDERRIVIR